MSKLNFGINIIESLNSDDDKDGKILHEILNVCRIKNSYSSINTKSEFIKAINEFANCGFRYLHLSFHGNTTGIALSDGAFISNSEFSEIIGNKLEKRRIFMSSCETGNFDLASKLITKNYIYSLIGSPVKIRFDKASLFFPSFYHLMNEIDTEVMKKEALKTAIKASADLFQIPITYYTFLRKNSLWNKNQIREYIYIPNEEPRNELKQIS